MNEVQLKQLIILKSKYKKGLMNAEQYKRLQYLIMCGVVFFHVDEEEAAAPANDLPTSVAPVAANAAAITKPQDEEPAEEEIVEEETPCAENAEEETIEEVSTEEEIIEEETQEESVEEPTEDDTVECEVTEEQETIEEEQEEQEEQEETYIEIEENKSSLKSLNKLLSLVIASLAVLYLIVATVVHQYNKTINIWPYHAVSSNLLDKEEELSDESNTAPVTTSTTSNNPNDEPADRYYLKTHDIWEYSCLTSTTWKTFFNYVKDGNVNALNSPEYLPENTLWKCIIFTYYRNKDTKGTEIITAIKNSVQSGMIDLQSLYNRVNAICPIEVNTLERPVGQKPTVVNNGPALKPKTQTRTSSAIRPAETTVTEEVQETPEAAAPAPEVKPDPKPEPKAEVKQETKPEVKSNAVPPPPARKNTGVPPPPPKRSNQSAVPPPPPRK
ncbi:MAG: hypothetical protein MJZ74_00335 [Muribaculaceae bacterium]|nr:hypothetical protein [Muribaculaceae bacterium]